MSKSNVDEKEKGSAISEKLVEALTSHYLPAENFAGSDDQKSTHELILEMSDIEEIFPYEINKLMEERGFKIHYDGKNYVWLLKLK